MKSCGFRSGTISSATCPIAGSFLLSESEAFTQLFTLGDDRADGPDRDGREPDDRVPALLVLEQPGRRVGGPRRDGRERPAEQERPAAGPGVHARRRAAVRRVDLPDDVTTPTWRSAATSRRTTCRSATSCSMPTATSSSRSRMAVGRPTSGSAPARGSRSPATGGSCITGSSRWSGRQAVRLPDADRHREGVVIPGPCRRGDGGGWNARGPSGTRNRVALRVTRARPGGNECLPGGASSCVLSVRHPRAGAGKDDRRQTGPLLSRFDRISSTRFAFSVRCAPRSGSRVGLGPRDLSRFPTLATHQPEARSARVHRE